MLKRTIIVKLILFGLTSCLLMISCNKSEEFSMAGTYESDKVKFYELPLFFLSGYRGNVVGKKMRLNADNSFEYRTCMYIENGNWEMKNDSLFLFVEANRFRVDSFNTVGYKGKFAQVSEKPIIFKIKDGCLFTQVKPLSGKKVLDRMKKIED